MRSPPARSSSSRQLTVEALEDRLTPATFLVSNENNAGSGSLRAAINAANATPGTDAIAFNIPGNWVHKIDLLSALPAIVDRVTITGTTQLGYDGTPRIVLDGTAAGAGASGLVVNAQGSLVRALAIYRFGVDGVRVQTDDCRVVGCYIGTGPVSLAAFGNGAAGVRVFAGATNATIGGFSSVGSNVIVANGLAGVLITGAGTNNNQVVGNTIGLRPDGTVALPNAAGVRITDGATGNVVGATFGNTISGNTGAGVVLAGAAGNTVLGNRIGTDLSGNVARANGGDGVSIELGSSSTQVTENQISGNAGNGVAISGNDVTSCVIDGNVIGLNAAGTTALGNVLSGVLVTGGASNNTVGGTVAADRNTISGNLQNGIHISGAGTNGNTFLGNFIGTNGAGTLDLGNSANGVLIASGAANNVVGGVTAEARNVISGNDGDGVEFNGIGTSGNTILGNFIGTDVNGTADLGNSANGVLITSGAANNVVGGATAGARNIISGNNSDGVEFNGTGTSGNTILGNYIGTDVNGTADLGNSVNGVLITSGADDNVVGGVSAGARNVISGNELNGIFVEGVGTTGTVIQGNFIGTDVTGTLDLGNGAGVSIGDAGDTLIGGIAPGAGNVISGNGFGVSIRGSGASGNLVKGNSIGTDGTGTLDLGNDEHGVFIHTNAFNNLIGGVELGAGNIIAHNGLGVLIGGEPSIQPAGSGNSVLGNSIFDHAALGIDLGTIGVTPNDTDDPDSGPNDLLNFPVLTSATLTVDLLLVSGSINTVQGKTLRIEFFASPTADPSGNGEGETFLGFTVVVMGTSNTATFSQLLLAPGVQPGQVITATATDELGNTSEFSLAQTVS